VKDAAGRYSLLLCRWFRVCGLNWFLTTLVRLMKWEEGWNRSVSSMRQLSSLNPPSRGNSRAPVLNSRFTIEFTRSEKHMNILICLELRPFLTKATNFLSEWLESKLQIERARFHIPPLRSDILVSVRPGRRRNNNPKYSTLQLHATFFLVLSSLIKLSFNTNNPIIRH
jgi:hypothetical protein